MLELTIRLIVSLAIVVGLLLVIARFASRRFVGGTGSMVRVVHRQALSRASSVAVVTVGSRVLVLGTTEQQVSLLTELTPGEVDLDPVVPVVTAGPVVPGVPGVPVTATPPTAPALALDASTRASDDVAIAAFERDLQQAIAGAPAAAPTRGSHRAHVAGPLGGSVLSPQTWRDAFTAATGRTK
jgi:flagellar protein FliO/FliZ